MCFLCLRDFDFELPTPTTKPAKPNLERKKKRIVFVKSLLALAVDNSDVCEEKLKQLKEEQYALSREF